MAAEINGAKLKTEQSIQSALKMYYLFTTGWTTFPQFTLETEKREEK